jgi:subtilisin family serine protease
MILLALLLSLFSPAHADELKSFVIETTHPLSAVEASRLTRELKLSSLSSFSRQKTGHFARVYSVESTQDLISRSHDLVVLIEPVFALKAQSVTPSNDTSGLPNDRLAAHQWGHFPRGQQVLRDLDDLHQEEMTVSRKLDWGFQAWLAEEKNYRSRKLIVAIVDGGVDFEHPDLKDQISFKDSECLADHALPPAPLIDRDNNGFAGDCAGWNFASDSKEGDNQTYDRQGHGTHVAGIIAAKVGNALGTAGFGAGIKILPVKVFRDDESSAGPVALSDRLARGLLYAIEEGADIINLSLGWPKVMHTRYLAEAIKLAGEKGVLIVAAAGNSSSFAEVYPCAIEEVLCVGAIGADGELASFSNYGHRVDILAPGEHILSTFPITKAPLFFSLPGYELKSGTSQAAPFVAGAMAALKSKFPASDWNELKTRLLSNARENLGTSSLVGLIDLAAALKNKPIPFIYPETKNIGTVAVTADGQFALTLSLAITNLSSPIEAEFLGSETIHINGRLNSNNQIEISGKIEDLIPWQRQFFTLKLTSAEHSWQYQIGLEFAHTLKASDGQSFSVESQKPLPLLSRSMTRMISRLKSPMPIGKVNNPGQVYYFGDKQTVYLFKIEAGQLREKIVRKLEKDCEALELHYGKEAHDQRPFYILETLCRGETPYLSYEIFDSSFQTQHQAIKHYPYQSLINWKEASVRLKSDGSFLSISFIASGKLPEDQQPNDPWLDRDNIKRPRLYQLSPKDLVFDVKTLDHQIPSGSLPIYFEDTQEQGQRALIRKGQFPNTELYQFNFTGDQITSEPIDFGRRPIESADILQPLSLNPKAPLIFANFFTPYDMSAFVLNWSELSSPSQRLYVPDLKDPLFDLIAAYSTEYGEYIVTRSYRYLHIRSLTDSTHLKLPYERLDFLSGQELGATIAPLAPDTTMLGGGLVIDGTAISRETMDIIRFEENQTYHAKKILLPASCATLNPIQNQNGNHIVLLCLDGAQVVLRQIDL